MTNPTATFSLHHAVAGCLCSHPCSVCGSADARYVTFVSRVQGASETLVASAFSCDDPEAEEPASPMECGSRVQEGLRAFIDAVSFPVAEGE